MSVPLPFYNTIDAIINKFDASSRWSLTECKYLFFFRLPFFILYGLQYTKSGFHEVRMERGLGQQTLPAQKCHQNISDMINVDILIYFFFSWSKTKLIITQSILRLKISCAHYGYFWPAGGINSIASGKKEGIFVYYNLYYECSTNYSKKKPFFTCHSHLLVFPNRCYLQLRRILWRRQCSIIKKSSSL